MKSIAAAVLLFAASPALAATPQAKLAGSWTMSGASEGGASCSIALSSTKTRGGWAIEAPKSCIKAFPRLKDAAAWTVYPDGAIGLVNPARARIYRFAKSDGGDFLTAPNRDGEQFVLSRAKAGKTMSAKQRMSGDWSLTSTGGSPKCAFISKADAKGLAGSLKMKPGCDSLWKGRGWSSWKISKRGLTLSDAKGKALQTFKKTDDVTFEGVTAKGNPIYFSRD